MEKKIRYGTLAVALLLVLGVMVNGAMATTSTVSGAFIFDKTTVTAGDKVNVALLGLDKNGIVDIYGEQLGAKIYATISSQLGTVTGGGSTPPTGTTPGSSGNFGATVKYVNLANGCGAAYVAYDATVSGNDSIQITLQEMYQSEGGGYVYKTIYQSTQTIVVNPQTSAAATVKITKFVKPSGDAQGVDANTSTTADLVGEMTVGTAGAQVTAEARLSDGSKDTVANGSATLTLSPAKDTVKSNKASSTYTFTGSMVGGVVTFTIDGTVTQAGTYYLKVEFNGKSSVGAFYADKVKVWPKTTITKLAIGSNKSVIGNHKLHDGATVAIYGLDTYGNKTTDTSTSALAVLLTDANGIASDQSLSVATNSSTFVLGTATISGASGLNSGKTGTTSITVKPSSSSSSIQASDALGIKVVDKALSVGFNSAFGATQNAGTSFNGFDLSYLDSTGTAKTIGSSTTINVKHYVSGVLIETAVSNLPANTSGSSTPLEVIFKKAPSTTPSDEYYVLGDQNGSYGEYKLTSNGAHSIVPASASSGTLFNAHGETKTTLGVAAIGANYVATIYNDQIMLMDAYGNVIVSSVGTFEVATPNGTVSTGTYAPYSGTKTVTNTATITYDPSKFVGTDDKIELKYSKAGVANTQLSTTVPAKATLNSILMSISTTKLPLNAIVALCIDALDANGKRVQDDTVVMNLAGSVLPTIKQITGAAAPNTAIASGQLVKFDSASTGVTGRNVFEITVPNQTGDFTITLQNAAGTVKTEKQFTVQAYAEQAKTVGDQPGQQKADVVSTENLNLVVNTTNTYGDTPAHQWFVFTGTASGIQLPLYLLGDKGIVAIVPGLDIYQYTYSYPAGSTVQIAQLKMTDLGLKAGDTFAYAYAYDTAAGKFVMDNVVILTVK